MNIVYMHDENRHSLWTASCSNSAGIVFTVNVFGTQVRDQEAVITRYDPKQQVIKNTNPKLIKVLKAFDSATYLLQNGADPNLDNGKYGNIGIAISGNDIVLIMEIRVNGINKPLPFVLRGAGI